MAGRSRAGAAGRFRRLAASLLVAIAASALGAPALAQTHCDSSDPLELWCATLTVGTTSQSGFTYTGYAIADADNSIPAFGSIAPNTFTYRTATIGVDILEYEGNSVSFEIARSSGTTPADGLLGPDTFTLEIGTGGTKNSFAIVNPGTAIYFEFPDPGLSWSVGDTVPVKLVRTNAAPAFSAGPQMRSIAENTAAGTNIGAPIPAATDTDGDTLTYSMEGTDAASFNFNASTRQITTKAGVTYDYEIKSSYSVTIKADDGNGGTATIAVTINLTDVSEAPPSTAHCNPSDPREFWCATMTVGTVTIGAQTFYGYLEGLTGSGTVSDTQFTYRGSTYTIDSIYRNADPASPELIFINDPTNPTQPPVFNHHRFTLRVGTTDFSFGNRLTPGNVFHWSNPGLSWSAGDTVPLKRLCCKVRLVGDVSA